LEKIVNVKKILDDFTWLKCNNALYNHIILPDIHELCLEKLLNTPEFEIQENDNQSVSDDHKLNCQNYVLLLHQMSKLNCKK